MILNRLRFNGIDLNLVRLMGGYALHVYFRRQGIYVPCSDVDLFVHEDIELSFLSTIINLNTEHTLRETTHTDINYEEHPYILRTYRLSFYNIIIVRTLDLTFDIPICEIELKADESFVLSDKARLCLQTKTCVVDSDVSEDRLNKYRSKFILTDFLIDRVI